MSMGNRIRERRKANNWSQARLAEESGISQQMLSKLERGKAFGTTEIVALARALDVSARWLETGKGPVQDSSLADEEREMLDLYRALGPAQRHSLKVLVESMLPPTIIPAYQAHIANQARRTLLPPPPPRNN